MSGKNPLTMEEMHRFCPRENREQFDDPNGRSERKPRYTQCISGGGQRRNIKGGMAVPVGGADSYEAIEGNFNHAFDAEDAMIAAIDKARLQERRSRGKMPHATPDERRAHERTIARKRVRREARRAA